MNETISQTPEFSANTLPSNHIYTVSKPASDKESFVFTGNGHDYFKIWIVNIALTIVTLGIYSAWAKVLKLQYIYRNTHFDGSSFDYHGKPLAILKGRVIAIAIYAATGLLSQYSITATVILGILIFLLSPLLIYAALRFNANMSSYRVVRFHFHGSIKDAFVTYLGWGLAAIFSLYLLFPVATQRHKRYIISNMRYGDAKFAFTAAAESFYMIFLKLFGMGILAVIVQAVLVYGLIASVGETAVPFAGIFMYMVFGLFLVPYATARINNLVFSNTKLESDKMYADYKVFDLIKLYFGNFIGLVFTLGLFYPYATIRNTKYRAEHTGFESKKILEAEVQNQINSPTAAGEEIASIFDVDIGM